MVPPNLAPDTSVAVHTHELAKAMRAVRAAKSAARLAGLDPGDLTRAIKMLSADPEKLARMQERVGGVLAALGAGTVVEADLFERVSDETPEQRADRIWRDGFLAAVLGDPCEPNESRAADAERWTEGWRAFVAAHADYTTKQRVSRSAKAA
jgi:hypothetical protein